MIVHLMWGIAGLTLGACLALLVVNNWTPNWIEATGTWFGAVATVLTLLWAVRSFRSDQVEREKARQADYEKTRDEQLAREQAEMNQAKSVSISLEGGAAYGSGPDQMMTSFHVRIKNRSKYGVSVRAMTLDERLKPMRPLPADVHVASGDDFRQMVEIQDVPARSEELSGRAMNRFTVEMTYLIDGHDWRRSSTSSPERL
ncbi:hypothetical protein ACU18_14200 [Arthrobacter sp. ZBG10]|nr:hypothetical protein ACU18_14200 [Arthrobacter sp. ZBG10]